MRAAGPPARPARLASPCRVEGSEAPLEQPPLGVVVREREGAAVRVAGLVRPAEAPQQLAACRVEVLVVVEREPVDDREAGLGAVGLGDRDGAAELDDGRVGEPRELA